MKTEIAKALSEVTTIENGAVTVGSDAFYAHAPEGLTEEVINQFRQYEADYIEATTQAFADKSIAYAKEHTDETTLMGEFGMGSGQTVTHSYTKTDEGWHPLSTVERVYGEDDVLRSIQNKAVSALNEI